MLGFSTYVTKRWRQNKGEGQTIYNLFGATFNVCRKAAVLESKGNNSLSDSDKVSIMKLKPETYGLEITEYCL